MRDRDHELGYVVGDEFLLLRGLKTIYYSGLLGLGLVIGLAASIIMLAPSSSMSSIGYVFIIASAITLLIDAGFSAGLWMVDKSFITSCWCSAAGIVVLLGGASSMIYTVYMVSSGQGLDPSSVVNGSITVAVLNAFSIIALGYALTRINEAIGESALSLAGLGMIFAGILAIIWLSSRLASLLYLVSLITMCYGLNRAITGLRMRLCNRDPSLCRYA